MHPQVEEAVMAREETVKLNVGMQVGYIANSTRECEVDTGISLSEWKAMSDEAREKVCEEYAQAEIDDTVSAWAVPVED
jgi:hypothetical protein